ncbi:hypothetical protein FUAX_09890 [Fulvitalea axinellae]|uniref:Uncharacterized protein n=1 Tax=Fulvitalea axinellae TaxID=1182444 RepID=A0AAU9CT38_9BACT|nr:hypothetical protein FUAX_09890 [Fulvitalea axinellae]
MKEKEYYTETHRIKIGNGKNSGAKSLNINLPSTYKRAVGLALVVHSTGGLAVLDFSLKDRNKDYISPTPVEMFQSSPEAGLSKDNRYHAIDLRTDAPILIASLNYEGTTTSEVMVSLVFLMEK